MVDGLVAEGRVPRAHGEEGSELRADGLRANG